MLVNAAPLMNCAPRPLSVTRKLCWVLLLVMLVGAAAPEVAAARQGSALHANDPMFLPSERSLALASRRPSPADMSLSVAPARTVMPRTSSAASPVQTGPSGASFLQSVLTWAKRTAVHSLTMFWWIVLGAIVVTALSESLWVEKRRRRLLQRPDSGMETVWLALQLGILSPPSRRRIFKQAEELLAGGVARFGVIVYLISAQSLLIFMLFMIVDLDGPQPLIGQFVAVGAVMGVLAWGVSRMPDALWQAARERARENGGALHESAPIGRTGPLSRRLARSVGGQFYALWWPILFGVLGAGFFMALGYAAPGFSLQGSKGPLVQLGNAGAGLVLAYVSSAPLIGNAYFAAGLWKSLTVSYAGLTAFYLGTLIMPFVLPRYFSLFGEQLGRKLIGWLVVAILVGALVATGWWYGLDGLAGLLGLQDAFHALTDSTLRPNDVPWFHHWFVPGP